MAHHTTAWLSLTALALCASARAQAGDQPIAPHPQSARHTDAHADRVVLSPTAETHPKGTLFASSYEIVLIGVGYAPTDRLQVSLVGTTDFQELGFFDFNLKANFLRSAWLRIAALSSVDVAASEGETLVAGRVGTTFQFCFELACRTSLSVSGTVIAHDTLSALLPIGLGAGFTLRMSEPLSGLLEYSGLFNASPDLAVFDDLPLFLVSYGARISTHPSWALDLAFIRRMQSDREIRTGSAKLFDLLGVPFVAFTYRGTL